jgi:hypothetical protein
MLMTYDVVPGSTGLLQFVGEMVPTAQSMGLVQRTWHTLTAIIKSPERLCGASRRNSSDSGFGRMAAIGRDKLKLICHGLSAQNRALSKASSLIL